MTTEKLRVAKNAKPAVKRVSRFLTAPSISTK